MTGQNIVITGEGIVSTIGVGKSAVSESLHALRTGIGTMRYLHSTHKELPVGEVKLSNDEMKAQLGIDTGKEISRTTLMGMMAVAQAVADAHLTADGKLRIVLISGTTVAGMDITERKFGQMLEHGVTDDSLSHHDCGSCTADIAAHFGLFADYTTISTACSSAANALLLGADMLKAGDADIVVAGGTEALSAFHLNGFNSLMILDHEVCRPFDKSRAGLNLGEGAAYVVLERADEAKQRGACIDAYLSGYGNACDAFHQTASSPDDTGAQLAMKAALDMAGLKPGDIQWVHAHGTGTPDNDASETVAIRSVFGDTLPLVSSTKGYTGHTTSASGGISAVISLIAMHEGYVPKSLGYSVSFDSRLIPVREPIHTELKHVMVNSFGFGGNDTSLILSNPNYITDTQASKHNEQFIVDADAPIVEAARVTNQSVEALKEIKQYVKPMEARRMGKLMKSTLLTSLRALDEAGIDMPDAIVTATSWGSMEYSEKLIRQLAEGDDVFKPTYFMQSTHNTIGSLIAIHLKCHGYNITFTQGNRSMYWAMYQARLLLRSGRCKTVLVGCHDESTQQFNTFLSQMGKDPLPPVNSLAVVLKLK